jgi:hypothetical protein
MNLDFSFNKLEDSDMKRFQSRLSQTSWNVLLRSGVASLATVILLTLAAGAASSQEKPDFTGHWILNTTKSDFGSAPKIDDLTENIQQNGSVIVIRIVTQDDGGKHEHNVSYTTDGAGNTNVVAGQPMIYKSHWEGESLVTVVRDERGGGYTETRSLSKDGKTQTVETVDPDRGSLKLVLDRR